MSTERLSGALLRARSAVSHFAASSSTTGDDIKCHKCGLPLNRWDETCDGALTAERLLALDVLWLVEQLEAKP